MPHETFEHPKDGSPLVLVPAGIFLMGQAHNDFLAEDHEKPMREVYLGAFWIDIYPVTNARFARFLEAGGYEQPTWWSADGWAWKNRLQWRQPLQWGQPGWDGPDQPVAGVSWYEADAYARWAGRRLPTDAEWEKAARGTDARRYPWGENWPTGDLANFDNRVGRSTPVGLYRDGVSPFGCYDMAGNVNNWTEDWYWPRFRLFLRGVQRRHQPVLARPAAAQPPHQGDYREGGPRRRLRHAPRIPGGAELHLQGPRAAADARAVERLRYRHGRLALSPRSPHSHAPRGNKDYRSCAAYGLTSLPRNKIKPVCTSSMRNTNG
jgi:formylglycine-generating enzyme required for sulfatase activity